MLVFAQTVTFNASIMMHGQIVVVNMSLISYNHGNMNVL